MHIFSIFETKDSVVKPTFKNRHNIDFFDILLHFIVLCLIETCRSQNRCENEFINITHNHNSTIWKTTLDHISLSE